MGFNPLTPMSDQDRIFSLQYQYNTNQISDENKEKYQFVGWLVDPILNSLN